ncbi:MAG: hypothetical protein QNJ94_08540 [Alphaproteobacteria bacterium]|nr:hypothetical protein [Alphaproteobacteria bacterium]
MTRILLKPWLLLLGMAFIWPAAAKDASIKAFYGVYQGSGIANSKDSLYFGITMRDLDVTIRPAGDGFRVEWTTVLRQGGTPENPRVRRKTSSISFRPTDNPRRFASTDRTDPLSEQGLSWARLKENTLTVHVLVISPEGKYNLQSYARTISGTGMDLYFQRIKDGGESRAVRGKLVKVAK